MAYVARGLAVVAGLAIILWVTLFDFSGRQFFLWIACCTAGAALLIWGTRGFIPRRRGPHASTADMRKTS